MINQNQGQPNQSYPSSNLPSQIDAQQINSQHFQQQANAQEKLEDSRHQSLQQSFVQQMQPEVELNVTEQLRKNMQNRPALGFDRKIEQNNSLKSQNKYLPNSIPNQPQKADSSFLNDKAMLKQNKNKLIHDENAPFIEFKVDQGEIIEVFAQQEGSTVFDSNFLESFGVEGKVTFVVQIGGNKQGQNIINNILNIAEFKPQAQQNVYMWTTPIYYEEDNINIYFADLNLELRNPLFNVILMLASALIVHVDDLTELIPIFQNIESIKQNFMQKIGRHKHMLPKLFIVQNIKGGFKDANGQPISSQQKLYDFLYSKNGQSEKIRQKIDSYFAFKFLLAYDSTSSQSIYVIRKKILDFVDQKQFNGQEIDGRMLSSFVQICLEDTQKKLQIDLEKSFKIAVENEIIYVYNECLEILNYELANEFQDDQSVKSLEELNLIIERINYQIIDKFYELKRINHPIGQELFQEYLTKLTSTITAKQADLKEVNLKIGLNQCAQIIKNHSTKYHDQNLENDIRHSGALYQKLIQEISLKYIGSNRFQQVAEILSQSQEDLTSLFIKEIQKIKSSSEVNLEDLQRQLKEKQKLAEEWDEKHKNTQKELDKAKQQNSQLDAQIKQLDKYKDLTVQNQQQIKELESNKAELQRRLLESQRKKKKCY